MTNTASNDTDTTAGSAGRIDAARSAVTDAFGGARERVSTAYDRTREAAGGGTQKALEGLQDNPVAALLGGLALGAIAAALLPRTEREVQAFGSLGTRLTGAAREAVEAAKQAGQGRLDELGLQNQARETVTKLFGDLGSVATTAGKAAAQAARGSGGGGQAA